MKIKDLSITILGGQNQIGGNIILLEYQQTKVLLDIGMPLDDADPNHPNMPFDQSAFQTIQHCIISHAHRDHWGYMDLLPSTCEIHSGVDTQTLVRITRFVTYTHFRNFYWKHFESGQAFDLGPIKITPYLIDHSAYDAYDFSIEVNGIHLLYTGDIRFHGRKYFLSSNLAKKLTNKPVDLLITEGTNLSIQNRPYERKSESDLEQDFFRVLSENNHPAIVQVAGQNIDRLVTIFKACRRSNRTLVFDPYTAFVLNRLNNRKLPQASNSWGTKVLMPDPENLRATLGGLASKVNWMKRFSIGFNDLKEIPNYVLIFRYWIGEGIADPQVLPPGSSFIYSMSSFYLDKMDRQWGSLGQRIKPDDIVFHKLHVSGHAHPDDLKRFMDELKPRYVLPIHTTNPDWFKQQGFNVLTNEEVI